MQQDQQLRAKMSLSTARILSGYTLEQVSTILDIEFSDLQRFEAAPSELSIETAARLLMLYGMPFSLVSFV
ncbi:hypothetical protein HGI30_16650 [Paenibacillus albicereus]|uniref:HTH cro/C1-type domain-containing protein n=1 Tax=Paenibacillus albicereus TaxID=2726185 RepID=A0A6H2H024_9BACL|nr:hypothetical protein [Paenibacillus albicereus]QJC53041.1 hypothetical protein HGI30_16650 [Paenibacillus albicereus]